MSLTIVAGLRQRSHSRVAVPYFNISDSRLPQPGGGGGEVPILASPRIRVIQL
jgi:hypothetical protein